MKRFIVPALILSAATVGAASVDRLIVRQQWPWHEGIQVEYALKGMTGPVDLTVEASQNGGAFAAVPREAITGDIYGVNDNIGTLTIDPAKAFSASMIDDLRIKITPVDSPESMSEALYKIFDLSDGSCTDVTRADLLNLKYGTIETRYAENIGTAPTTGQAFSTTLDDILIWTGVTNDIAYRTEKMVMRKIHAKDKVWQSGDPAGAETGNGTPARTQYWNKFTYDYYIGVFEVTLDQYKRINGSYPSGCAKRSGDTEPYLSPANCVYQGALYGCLAKDKHYYPSATPSMGKVTGEPICFPTNSYVRDVSADSVAGKMWDKTGIEFTLPTRAEWEDACEGGNSSVLYSGLPSGLTTNKIQLGWVLNNAGDDIHFGGEKPCNAYGLYDMLGNVMERVLGVGQLNQGGAAGSGDGLSQASPVIDPLGNLNTTETTHPSYCGGAWCKNGSSQYIAGYHSEVSLRHAAVGRGYVEYYTTRDYLGFRFAMPATANGQWADHD